MDRLDEFFERLRSASSRMLLLDYDGTLAPFVAARSRAVPYAGVPGVLARIMEAERTRLVIVSGRAASEVADLLGLDPAPEILGCHGWERRGPDGATRLAPLPESARTALESAGRTLIAAGMSEHCEIKPAGIAVHWRGLAPRETARVEAVARATLMPLAATAGVRLDPFDGGLELRPSGRDKGTVVRELLREMGSGAVVAYLGDDRTDEDAFHALGGHGLAVLVARAPRSTAAGTLLRSADEVLAFLGRWERAVASVWGQS